MFKRLSSRSRFFQRCLAVAFGLSSLVAAQSDKEIAFLMDDVPITQDEVELNRLALSLDRSKFPTFSVSGSNKISAKQCPITFYERDLEQFAYDMQTAALFHVTLNTRPTQLDFQNLISVREKDLDYFFAQKFQPAQRSQEEFHEALRKREGLFQVIFDMARNAQLSNEELVFYQKMQEKDQPLKLWLLEHRKYSARFQRWVDGTRKNHVFSGMEKSEVSWNPVIFKIDDGEVTLTDFLRYLYFLNGFYLFDSDPLDSTDAVRGEMILLSCLLEQEEFSGTPIDFNGLSVFFRTQFFDGIRSVSIPLTFSDLRKTFLERMIDEVVVEKFISNAKLPFITTGSKLVSELKKFQARDVKVTDAEIRIFFGSHKQEYITESSVILSGAWFKSKDQAVDFRAKLFKNQKLNWQILTKKLGVTVENYGRRFYFNLPDGCRFCLDEKRFRKLGNEWISDVIYSAGRYGVVLRSGFVPRHPSLFEEVRAEVSADTLQSAKEKYGRAWLAAERKNHVIVNNLPEVMKELEARVKHKPR
jgi:hypothetical protein